MKIIVLGGRGAYSSKDEGCSGYLIQEDDYNLLIDCGSGTVSALQKQIKLSQIDSVIISHYHADHFSDISILQHGIMIESLVNKQNKNLVIYGHNEDKLFNTLSYKSYSTGKAYQEDSQLHLGPFKISFLKNKHSVPCFTMNISCGDKKIIYTADTAYFKELIDFTEKADLIIAECSLYPDTDGKNMGHMNSTDAAMLAENARVKKLLLTHLPNYGDNNILLDNAKKYFYGPISMAKSKLEIEV